MSAELIHVQTAVAEFDKVAAGIAELKGKYAGVVYDVKTTKGLDEAKAARAAIREPRYEIERVRKAAKAPILKLGKELDSRAESITAEILEIEEPIDQQIKNEESRKENEKQAKIDAERKRVEEIQRRIEAIRAWPTNATNKPSSLVEQMFNAALAYTVTPELFDEFIEAATVALDDSRAALSGILVQRREHEAEQERIKAERAELERLRKEQADRDRVERDRRDEEDRRLKAQRDAEAAAEREALRQQREELERQERERQAALRAEQERLAVERREFEQQQEQARAEREAEQRRKADEERRRAEQARISALKKPPDDELLGVLAAHYQAPVEKVAEWLLAVDFSKLEAA